MWTVKYTKRFLKELAALPAEVQARVESILFQEPESEDPYWHRRAVNDILLDDEQLAG